MQQPGRGVLDLALVSMPVVALERPSIALGLLKGSALRSGVRTRVFYPSFSFAERIGATTYSRIQNTAPELHLGDWIFAGPAFREKHSPASYLSDPKGLISDSIGVAAPELAELLERVSLEAERLVRATALNIVETGARVVGCSSMFSQHVGSLALLREIKDLDPSIVTIMGGANCEDAMGRATHREFSWIDYVVSGEADLFFGSWVASLLASSDELREIPPGVFTPADRDAGYERDPGRGRVEPLDQSPVPDYFDYFDDLAASSLASEITPALLAESSRGCWWGEKHHCTFCGLNGSEMTYRPKSPDRVISEFTELAESHGVPRILVVDNIIHPSHITTVVQNLKDAGAPYSVFYETKANHTREQIELLSDAGVRRVQPGLESLCTEALTLMQKGTSAVLNLQYLRSARSVATFVTWNFLKAIPGEDWSWYGSVADWIPKVTHLQPPNSVCNIRFDRFSVYWEDPASFGLDLVPVDAVSSIYPVNDDSLEELSYYFRDVSRPVEAVLRVRDPELLRFQRVMADWMRSWDRIRRAEPEAPPIPVLEMSIEGDCATITEKNSRRDRRFDLDPTTSAVLVQCDAAPSRGSLARKLAENGIDLGEAAVEDALETLSGLDLILELDERILALPTWPQRKGYLRPHDYPGGWFDAEHEAHRALR